MFKAPFVLEAFADTKETTEYCVWQISRLKKIKLKAQNTPKIHTVLKHPLFKLGPQRALASE